MKDIGFTTSLDTYARNLNLKGVHTESSGIQYVFFQIATSVYSIQILFMNDTSSTVRDKVAFRISIGENFAGIGWTWLKTSSIIV